MATLLSILVLVGAATLWGAGLWLLLSISDAIDDRGHDFLALVVSAAGYLLLNALIAAAIVAALFAIWSPR